jgi:hypothetical protein
LKELPGGAGFGDFAVSSQFCETVRDCSVTGENDSVPPAIAGFEQITIVAPVGVPLFSRAPVIHTESADIDLARSGLNTLGFAPIEFCDLAKACSSQQIARAASSDHAGVLIETAQRSQIKVIKVRMRKKNEIDLGQLINL